MKVRVYGSSVGYGSLARVAAGMCEGLMTNDAFAGFVPVDVHDDEAVYAGAEAEIAIFSGPMDRVSVMTSVGWHKQRWALLPANSTWVPVDLVRSMEKYVTGFVAPSQWAVQVLEKCTELPVKLYRHGVSKEFVHREVNHEGFSVLHLASTSRQRKGTSELAQAWRQVVHRLGPYPRLWCKLSDISEVTEWLTCGEPRACPSIFVGGRSNLGDVSMSRMYSHHDFICQPSRGEGFGLIPLEALACGVPIIATGCTGHSEYVGRAVQGTVIVPTGSLEPIDDGPGALAPSLSVDDLAKSLVEAFERRDELRQEALDQAKYVHKFWSWKAVTRHWLDQL
jgi:glycosyl transferase family 1